MDTERLKEKKGPKGHRVFVMVLNILLGLLIYWFLGFLMDDISEQPGPSLVAIQKKYQDPVLVKDREAFNDQLKKISVTIAEQQQQQSILQTSINSYRDTMNQLVGLQKASIQKGVTFAPESQQNLQQISDLYLQSQKQFQELNNAITKDNLTQQHLQNQINEIDAKLATQNEQANKEYQAQWVNHNWAMAGLQLLVLIPLLLIAAYLLKVYKTSLYKPMLMAAAIAVFCKIALVMHDYFPSYIFKYVLILALIYITIVTLIAKLRMIAAPKPDWLEKQYREAYQKIQCPICQYPVKPGVAKLFTQEHGTNLPLTNLSYLDEVKKYTCPGCGELLLESCTHCDHLRYSLLKYCDCCGATKEKN